MATYNGARFLEEQIRSILEQLTARDELIVVDDCSADSTIPMIESFRDSRIRLYRNDVNKGVNATFERAISLSTNPVVLMSDQDDIWLQGRVDQLIDTLTSSGALVVSSNTRYVDAKGSPINYAGSRVLALESRRHFRNILRIFSGNAGYFGCAMAFRREIMPLILPIPEFVESHDLWIALASNLIKSNVHCEADTLARRIHGNNASVIQRRLLPRLNARVIFARSLLVLWTRKLVRANA